MSYNILFAQVLGASATVIGLLRSVGVAMQALAGIFIGLAIDKHYLRKVMLLGILCDILAMVIFILAWDWHMLIPAFILFSLVRQMPLTDLTVVTFSNRSKRLSVMGLMRTVWGIASTLSPVIAGILVEYFGGITVGGIRPLYYLALVFFLLTFVVVWKRFKASALVEGYNVPSGGGT